LTKCWNVNPRFKVDWFDPLTLTTIKDNGSTKVFL
jgi:hypothetical protein